MHWRRNKILQVALVLLILCAGVSAQAADSSACHFSVHHQTSSCDLCLAAHAPAIITVGALHRVVSAPPVAWREGWHNVSFIAEPELTRDLSRGPPSSK
jgi:hypothetical protein